MLVFVSSPYRGNVKRNVEFARQACDMEAAEFGNTPIAPHLFLPQFIDDDEEAIEHGLEILARCDELHAYGPVISAGMHQEIDYARSMDIPVKFMDRGD